jgi:hypothetical protein
MRRLDLIETWFLDRSQRAGTSPERETDGITLGLKLSFPEDIAEPIPYLQRAWLVLRYLHPLLGALYPPFSDLDESGKPLITVSPLDPEAWIKVSFFVNKGDEALFVDPYDAVKSFRASETATAHWFPDTSQLLLRTSHLRFDGIGILKAANTFMLVLASTFDLGLEAPLNSYASDVKQPSLAPGIDCILGFPTPEAPTSPAPAIERAVEELTKEWRDGMYSGSLPLREGGDGAAPANTRHLLSTFDECTLQAIKKACKGLGVSVSAAVHASIVRTIAACPQHPDAHNMLITLIANMRRFLGSDFDIPDYAASPCCYVVPFCLRGGLSDENSAGRLEQRLHAIYASDLAALPLDPLGDPVDFSALLPLYTKREAVILDAPPVEGAPPFRPPNLSSFGVLERWVKPSYGVEGHAETAVGLEDIWVAVEMTDQTPEFQLMTFRGTMRLHLCFNDAYYTEEYMADILQKVRYGLLHALGTVSNMSTVAS